MSCPWDARQETAQFDEESRANKIKSRLAILVVVDGTRDQWPQAIMPVLAKYVQTGDRKWSDACIAMLQHVHDDTKRMIAERKCPALETHNVGPQLGSHWANTFIQKPVASNAESR